MWIVQYSETYPNWKEEYSKQLIGLNEASLVNRRCIITNSITRKFAPYDKG